MPTIKPEESLLRLHVEFDMKLPVLASKEEITEWLNCYMGASSRIELGNPLLHHEPYAIKGTVKWKAF